MNMAMLLLIYLKKLYSTIIMLLNLIRFQIKAIDI